MSTSRSKTGNGKDESSRDGSRTERNAAPATGATAGAAGLRGSLGNQGMQRLLASSSGAAKPVGGLPVAVSRALAGPAAALPDSLRASAQRYFGASLAGVRVHAGGAATHANQTLESHAFSVGRDIVLADPAALGDQRLMAHEIAHVLQPGAASSAPLVSHPGDAAEREAHVHSDRLARNTHARHATALSIRRSAHIHRDARHPTATVFDADYLLYGLDGTDYDNATQHYYLSPWDRAHLQRRNGLYLLEASSTSLITPPEVRGAAGGRGVLLSLSAPEVAALVVAGRAGASQFVIDLAQRRLGVSVSSITLSTAPDADFTRQALPTAVSGTLSSPLVGVDAAGTAGVEAARSRARSATQDRSLSLEATRREEPPMRDMTSADLMDVRTHFGRDDAARAAWYVERLSTLQMQLFESAATHRLPMQLLAAVILNELADINKLDVWQSGPGTFGGSLGLAQIQVNTALRDRLVDLPAGAHREGLARAGMHIHGSPDAAGYVAMGERLRIGQLLQVPQVAIEAAAREIEMLLTRMGSNLTRPWQVSHNFTASGPQGDAIYAHVGSGSQQSREGTLADAVCGAYNSPDVITTSDTSRYTNATIHGSNANDLAQDLYRFRLYRTS